ncbi:hypothetical protein N7493_008108 [Penicillium malachiteum]|uniref:DUF676 domain-containing protein n=1 Tax=Penicillium malachiteum TaxID=1324776 RepID=A0AAD6HGI8_9EURO|nr:hypothetical protein N7493_008108 [Penicillium malachiteum]
MSDRAAIKAIVKPSGLTAVYTPRNPTVDIVFVHGLNGHPYDTWTSQSGCFWPVELLVDALGPLQPRILTYGYKLSVEIFTDGAPRDSFLAHGETLVGHLSANRNLRDCADRPIIFVCHSLGGLVVKSALIHSHGTFQHQKLGHLYSVYLSTFKILFLGTPHDRSGNVKWGSLLRNICTAVLPEKFLKASPQVVTALCTNNERLQRINSQFEDIMSVFKIYFFYENRLTDPQGALDVAVDETSAAPYIPGAKRSGIDADHAYMCKFEGRNDPCYEMVAEAILQYSSQAPTVIANRWLTENSTTQTQAQVKKAEVAKIPRAGCSSSWGTLGEFSLAKFQTLSS